MVASGKQMFAASEYGRPYNRNGSWCTMRASASQLFDAENKLSGVIISVRDNHGSRRNSNSRLSRGEAAWPPWDKCWAVSRMN